MGSCGAWLRRSAGIVSAGAATYYGYQFTCAQAARAIHGRRCRQRLEDDHRGPRHRPAIWCPVLPAPCRRRAAAAGLLASLPANIGWPQCVMAVCRARAAGANRAPKRPCRQCAYHSGPTAPHQAAGCIAKLLHQGVLPPLQVTDIAPPLLPPPSSARYDLITTSCSLICACVMQSMDISLPARACRPRCSWRSRRNRCVLLDRVVLHANQTKWFW